MAYQRVCGRARGYQKGTPDGFRSGSVNDIYVDGLSITHGSPRQHIWTYVAGHTDRDSYTSSSIGVHVLRHQDQLLLLLLDLTITVNLEQKIAIVYLYITCLTHYGMEVVVLQAITVAPI